MIRHPLWLCPIVGAMLLMSAPVRGQDAAAIDHARRVMDAIVQEQFEAVTKAFNAQMAAALPAQKLQELWRTLLQQTGAFKAIIDARSQPAGGGVTAVLLGCQFERAALNAIIAFDTESKIAGLRFVPRPVAAASPPPGRRFREHAVTVGTGSFGLVGMLSLPTDQAVASMVLATTSRSGSRRV